MEDLTVSFSNVEDLRGGNGYLENIKTSPLFQSIELDVYKH